MPFNRGGTTYYLVIGVGVVSVSNTNTSVARVVKTDAIGITGTPHGVTVGYTGSSVISVNTNQNILVEVQRLPGKPLTVCVPLQH